MSKNRTDFERMVEQLVHEHFEFDDRLESVIWIAHGMEPEIRLIQVTPETFPSRDVLAFYFPPSDEVPYPLLIAQVTPDEWQMVLRGEIPLPDGWSLDDHKVLSREMVLV